MNVFVTSFKHSDYCTDIPRLMQLQLRNLDLRNF
jgi:hypothetical protein